VNPTALLLTSVQLLRYLDLFEKAKILEDAILLTLSEGKVLTGDLNKQSPASTSAFSEEVIKNLGRPFTQGIEKSYKPIKLPTVKPLKAATQKYVGFDVFIQSNQTPTQIGDFMTALSNDSYYQFVMCSNRGANVYPLAEGQLTDCVDHFRCRFKLKDLSSTFLEEECFKVLQKISKQFEWMHISRAILNALKPSYFFP
jgi:isocitrate dehydrogenase